MPVITLDYFDLKDLVKRDLTKEEMANIIPMLGADLKKIEMDEIHMEFFPNRPDLYSVEGVARALNAFLQDSPGLKKYEVHPSDWVMNVEKTVLPVRPYVACGYATNITMDDYLIVSLMNMQEKLHLTMGRNRKKVSIGIHDTREILGPLRYYGEDPNFTFIPLQMDEKMSMSEILKRHPKGIDYASILDGFNRYPLIRDTNGKVLSFPPIINGIVTTVRDDTTEMFIDVTGTDEKEVNVALNIVATALVERGAKIHQVAVKYPDKVCLTPNLEPKIMEVDADYPATVLGIEFADGEVISLLEKMGYDAQKEEGVFKVSVPPYRNDILHPIDIVEDIGIGYGHDNFPATLSKAMTFGSVRSIEKDSKRIRELMIGHGYLEVTTLTLSSQRDQFVRMDKDYHDAPIIANPLTEDHDCLRVSLLPSLLEILQANKHRELPQRIFEIGDAVIGVKNVKMFSALEHDSKASFTTSKSLVENLFKVSGIEYTFLERDHPSFIPGRCVKVMVNDMDAGIFGELHPKVITAFELKNPVIGLELKMEVFSSR